MRASSDVERATGALLGTFVGDAIGMPFEGAESVEVPTPLEMVDARLGAGTYTDDTQMMIALAESLIEHGRVEPEALADAFRDAYDPRRGYGGGTRAVIELWKAGVAVGDAARQVFDGEGSRGNGAAMRVAPIPVRFADGPGRLVAEAAASAVVTHAHPVAIDAAVVQAAAIGAALRGEDILSAALGAAETQELVAALQEAERLLVRAPDTDEARARLGSSSDAARSVPTAIYTALSHAGFEQAIRFAVGLGGDTDTVAAMAGAIVGARDGAGAIPERWLDGLEDERRGRSHVERLASRLLA